MAAAALFLTAVPAAAAERQAIYSDDPASAAVERKYGYAEAVVAGDTAYVSGVPAVPRPGENGPEAAFVRAFDRLGKVLAKLGATWADVVEVRSFHTDAAGQFAAIAEVKRRYMTGPDPAWTAVGTSGLIASGAIAEISLVVRLRAAKP